MANRRATGARPDKTVADTALARLRLALDVKQEALARAIGLPLRTYQREERREVLSLPVLVNAGIALTGDPLALLHEHVGWQ